MGHEFTKIMLEYQENLPTKGLRIITVICDTQMIHLGG